jgi:hypothetical protein
MLLLTAAAKNCGNVPLRLAPRQVSSATRGGYARFSHSRELVFQSVTCLPEYERFSLEVRHSMRSQFPASLWQLEGVWTTELKQHAALGGKGFYLQAPLPVAFPVLLRLVAWFWEIDVPASSRRRILSLSLLGQETSLAYNAVESRVAAWLQGASAEPPSVPSLSPSPEPNDSSARPLDASLCSA